MQAEARLKKLQEFVKQVQGQLIVSCQATPEEALFGSDIMAKMALSAQRGGAKAIRSNSPADVKAICQTVNLPVIGLYKEVLPDYPVIITPTLKHALAIADAGADVIAIDATNRPHPEGDVHLLIEAIHDKTDCLVMADISTLEEGLAAQAAGADMVSSTLSGYTDYSPQQNLPDLELVKHLAQALTIPVFAEGRYHTPEQVVQALTLGATGVVVGGAITRPHEITARYIQAINAR
ncbi:MAG: N-acetylmannosamine-6-phosphate 2-epimerase [Chloroflexi bacterium]|nr:N-acetylmannosamine-6-phosphate 2-epimerase [Chloroflexota bacterium]